MAAKLTKNLGPPSSTLHVANLPEDLTHVEVKVNIQSLDHVSNLKIEKLAGHVHRERFHGQGV